MRIQLDKQMAGEKSLGILNLYNELQQTEIFWRKNIPNIENLEPYQSHRVMKEIPFKYHVTYQIANL